MSLQKNWANKGIQEITFGESLRRFRFHHDLTLKDASRLFGLHSALWREYEEGKRFPDFDMAYRMAEKVGMDPKKAIVLLINEQLIFRL